MKRSLIWAVKFAAAALLLGTSAAQGQIESASGRAWFVRRHEDDKHPMGDIAFRLQVTERNGQKLKAMLTRYDGTTTSSTAVKVYQQRTGDGGKFEVKGKITRNDTGPQHERKQVHFELNGFYFDTDSKLHLVRIFGYYHTGMKKNSGTTNRDDDRLCMRICEKDFLSPGMLMKDYGPLPCDEQPPDEDVLADETIVDPPVYDP